jgi:outer membrane protein
MTRSLGGALLGLLALTVLAASPAAAQQGTAARAAGAKIGFIDSRLIMRSAPGYAQAESTFTKELAGIRAEVTKLQQSYDSAGQAFDQQSVVLSPSQKSTKQKELDDLRQKSEQRTQELQQRAAQRERELIDPIQQRVNALIEAVRAEGGYAVIFDAGAPGSAIVAADKNLDLTNRVVARLKTAK